MNNVVLVGRLTRDPNVRYTSSANGQMCIARFTVACDRAFKRDGQPTADFISCVAFGKQGEFVEKYFNQGKLIGIQGSIQTGSYEKDGQKVYTTDVVVDRVEFVGSKSESSGNGGGQGSYGGSGYGGGSGSYSDNRGGFGGGQSGSSNDRIPDDFIKLADDDMPF